MRPRAENPTTRARRIVDPRDYERPHGSVGRKSPPSRLAPATSTTLLGFTPSDVTAADIGTLVLCERCVSVIVAGPLACHHARDSALRQSPPWVQRRPGALSETAPGGGTGGQAHSQVPLQGTFPGAFEGRESRPVPHLVRVPAHDLRYTAGQVRCSGVIPGRHGHGPRLTRGGTPERDRSSRGPRRDAPPF
jgi:hypothetical protein